MICRCAVPAVALALAGSLVACSSSGSSDKATPGPTVRPTSTTPSPTAIPTQPTSVPSSVPNGPKRKMVTQGACQAITGGWENSGTVKNTTARTQTYTITIFFTTNPGGTVLGDGATKVSVASGASKAWRVAAKFPATKAMNCVLRGVG